MKIRDLARRHPMGLYFGLVYAISWIGCSLIGVPIFLRGEPVELWKLAIMGLLVLAGPLVAGLAMTSWVDGRPGLRDLFSRMGRWRVGLRWYAALLIFPVLLLAVSLALSAAVSPELAPIFFTPGIAMGLLAGMIEEVGWMGFAFPKMLSTRSLLGASLHLGFWHGLWHAVPSFLGSYRSFGSAWLPYFLGFLVFVIALRILIVWVYANTGSLLLAQLMHASSTGFFAILIPTNTPPGSQVIFYAVYAVVLSAAAWVVVARYGRGLRRRSPEATMT